MCVASEPLEIKLSYPPSVNSMTAAIRGRLVQTAKIRHYYSQSVREIWSQLPTLFSPFSRPVSLVMTIYPPSNRKVDLDNRIKAVQDSLQKSGVLINDDLVDELHVVRGSVVKDGLVRLKVFSLS